MHMHNMTRGIIIAENNIIRTILELDLCILVTHLYFEFQLKISMNDRMIMSRN